MIAIAQNTGKMHLGKTPINTLGRINTYTGLDIAGAKPTVVPSWKLLEYREIPSGENKKFVASLLAYWECRNYFS
jgi:hypothetical protein